MGAHHRNKKAASTASASDDLIAEPPTLMHIDVLPHRDGGDVLICIKPVKPIKNPTSHEVEVCAGCVGKLFTDPIFLKIMAGQAHGHLVFTDLQSLNMFLVWYSAHFCGDANAQTH